MTIQAIRRAQLAKLIKERYKSQADFVSSTGENQGEVSGLLNAKSFGEKKARKIEVKVGLPVGWLDSEQDVLPSGAGRAEAPRDGRATHSGPPWMAPEAFQLLEFYYASDENGRAEIMNTAADFGATQTDSVIHHKG